MESPGPKLEGQRKALESDRKLELTELFHPDWNHVSHKGFWHVCVLHGRQLEGVQEHDSPGANRIAHCMGRCSTKRAQSRAE